MKIFFLIGFLNKLGNYKKKGLKYKILLHFAAMDSLLLLMCFPQIFHRFLIHV